MKDLTPEIELVRKPFHFSYEEGEAYIKAVPLVKIHDLVQFTKCLFLLYSDHDMLTSHDGVIPETEIWVKIGGDHGPDSFKIPLQIMNVKSPNSKHHTVMIGYAKVKDKHANLKLIFEEFHESIIALAER